MALVAVVYAIFLAVSPFEHHDLACHLKNPEHCTVCASSVVGSDPQNQLTATGAADLADAGSAVAEQHLLEGALLEARSTGRSPPAAI